MSVLHRILRGLTPIESVGFIVVLITLVWLCVWAAGLASGEAAQGGAFVTLILIGELVHLKALRAR